MRRKLSEVQIKFDHSQISDCSRSKQYQDTSEIDLFLSELGETWSEIERCCQLIQFEPVSVSFLTKKDTKRRGQEY